MIEIIIGSVSVAIAIAILIIVLLQNKKLQKFNEEMQEQNTLLMERLQVLDKLDMLNKLERLEELSTYDDMARSFQTSDAIEKERFDNFEKVVESKLTYVSSVMDITLKRVEKVVADNNILLNQTVTSINDNMEKMRTSTSATIENMRTSVGSNIQNMIKTVTDNVENMRNTLSTSVGDMSKTLSTSVGDTSKTMTTSVSDMSKTMSTSVSDMSKTLADSMEKMRNNLTDNLTRLNKQNKESIDEMRVVVDEKLSQTLEKRLNASFSLINNSLEGVNKGLGDMQSLAKDVGGLKNVLQNVKVRGTWAEMQLDNMLSQMLTADQYIKCAQVNARSQERVDFAIKLPGKDKEPVLLPIDSKFPIEEFQRLITASQQGDQVLADKALKNLETRVREEAKSISNKYISVPKTTDFAVMYLPLEGLYAEVVRKDGLYERLLREYRVMVCGPSTLGALLSSLQMGFKTVAIEKKSSEIHKLLLVFKREFVKFNDLLEKTQKKINEASNTIDDASKKTRTITTKLNKVEEFSQDLMSTTQYEIGGIDES